MVDVVIGFDKDKNLYQAYEQLTDTLLVTSSLGDTFNKLEKHLKDCGIIAGDLLSEQNITYHIDSPTFIAMVKSNADLLKRLNNAPSSFMVSSQKLGISNYKTRDRDRGNDNSGFKKSKRKRESFSKSNIIGSVKKLGMK